MPRWWPSHRLLLIVPAMMLLGAFFPTRSQAQDVFASSGRACGYPNARYDWERVRPAVKNYPNGAFFILTPREKRELETRFSAWNERGGQPMRMMAPCFNCSPQYELCIVYDRDWRPRPCCKATPVEQPKSFSSRGSAIASSWSSSSEASIQT